MKTEKHEISGKIVVIAGASSGFDRGTALEIARQGANVVVAARRIDLLDGLVSEIVGVRGKGVSVKCDVSSAAEVAKLKDTAVQRYGCIDVWVNNIGVGALGLFWDIPIEDHARLIDVDLKGLLFGAHAALLEFNAQGFGVLVNVGSIDSEVPLAYQASYAATKAAVLNLSRSLNEELRLAELPDIKVAIIVLWAVDIPWWAHAANYTGHQPRMAAMDDPELVVDAIVGASVHPKEEMPVGPKAHASNVSHHLSAILQSGCPPISRIGRFIRPGARCDDRQPVLSNGRRKVPVSWNSRSSVTDVESQLLGGPQSGLLGRPRSHSPIPIPADGGSNGRAWRNRSMSSAGARRSRLFRIGEYAWI